MAADASFCRRSSFYFIVLKSDENHCILVKVTIVPALVFPTVDSVGKAAGEAKLSPMVEGFRPIDASTFVMGRKVVAVGRVFWVPRDLSNVTDGGAWDTSAGTGMKSVELATVGFLDKATEIAAVNTFCESDVVAMVPTAAVGVGVAVSDLASEAEPDKGTSEFNGRKVEDIRVIEVTADVPSAGAVVSNEEVASASDDAVRGKNVTSVAGALVSEEGEGFADTAGGGAVALDILASVAGSLGGAAGVSGVGGIAGASGFGGTSGVSGLGVPGLSEAEDTSASGKAGGASGFGGIAGASGCAGASVPALGGDVVTSGFGEAGGNSGLGETGGASGFGGAAVVCGFGLTEGISGFGEAGTSGLCGAAGTCGLGEAAGDSGLGEVGGASPGLCGTAGASGIVGTIGTSGFG